MNVIPSINEMSFAEVEAKIHKAEGFFNSDKRPHNTAELQRGRQATSDKGVDGSPSTSSGTIDLKWVHLDVTDGAFTKTISWNNPEDLKSIKTNLGLEVHLMVENPEAVLGAWLEALSVATTGGKRVIIHFEVMSDPAYILAECQKFGVEAGLALKPNTNLELVSVYLRSFALVQILAVMPGPSGQIFKPEVLDKIKFLRSKSVNVIIEVDGGMNPATAHAVKEAGANIIVSGSYIWGNPAPASAYEKLAGV